MADDTKTNVPAHSNVCKATHALLLLGEAQFVHEQATEALKAARDYVGRVANELVVSSALAGAKRMSDSIDDVETMIDEVREKVEALVKSRAPQTGAPAATPEPVPPPAPPPAS